jgi:CubicO group peptidase (beta-lactamase class C family)
MNAPKRAMAAWTAVGLLLITPLNAGDPSSQPPSTSDTQPPPPNAQLTSVTDLDVTLDLGDLNEMWMRVLGVEGTELLHFRWKSTSSSAAKGTWEVRDQNNVVVQQGQSGVLTDQDGYRRFSIHLGTVNASAPLTVWVQPLTSTDTIGGALSNPVYLNPAEAPETCFTDGGLGLPIREKLAAILLKHKVPALAGAIVTPGGLSLFDALGIRSVDSQEPVTPYDKWHLGSISKSMTGTLAAVLMQKHPNLLAPNTSIGAAFQNEPWVGQLDPTFASITIKDLMAHRSGISVIPASAGAILTNQSLSVPARRKEFVRVFGQNPPTLPIGFTWEYRNQNFVIAAAMLEAIFGQPWETLIQQELFGPLGMNDTGFGTADLDGVYQPAGHAGDENGNLVENRGDNDPAYGPSSTVHSTLADLAKYVQLYLNGSEGGVTLSPSTQAMLKAPYYSLYGDRYNFGWGNGLLDGKVVLGHAGSNMLWYASISIWPEHGYGFLAMTNVATVGADPENDDPGDERGKNAVTETMKMLIDHQTACPDDGEARFDLGASAGGSFGP